MSWVPVTVHTDIPIEFGEGDCLVPLSPALPARQGEAGNARWDVTIPCACLVRKGVFGTLLLKHLPTHTPRTAPQTEYSKRSYMNLGYRAEKIKKGG